MREAIYSGINRSGICVCGHSWDSHQLNIIMRMEYCQTDGGPEAYMPGECEYYGSNEDAGKDRKGKTHCTGYRDNKKINVS